MSENQLGEEQFLTKGGDNNLLLVDGDKIEICFDSSRTNTYGLRDS